MAGLAEVVLPLIRTRSDVHRWESANVHGRQLQEAAALLEQAAASGKTAEAYPVTQRAIAGAVKIILP